MERLALREVAKQIGAFDFLSKPFVVSELVETVRRSVEAT
jgi:FixJ family two-component response regulator